MSALDKAVSTEDLCAKEDSPALGVLRLEAILNTLVENKVEALKQENEKTSSLHSSPKDILQKLKFHSSPKATLRIEDETHKNSKRRERKEKSQGKQFKKQMLRQETSSPDSQILQVEEKCLSHQDRSTSCMDSSCPSHVCYCSNGQMPLQMADEFISIKMDSYGDVETDAIIAREEMRRERRKRRRRRKRRLKKRLALNPHLVDTFAHESDFKTFHDDELPPRAKWTIVATACLLLFMCLLLVGITLRMAPIIDEIGARRLQKTVSLEEIYSRQKQRKSKGEQRRKSELLETGGLSRKNSAKKLRKKSSQRRPSKLHDIERGSTEASPPGSRLNSESQSSKGGLRRQQSKESQWRQQRRKRIIKAILGVYIFLLFISILSVVVTLTHTSTATVLHNNSTKNLTYYTFSPSPGVPHPDKT